MIRTIPVTMIGSALAIVLAAPAQAQSQGQNTPATAAATTNDSAAPSDTQLQDIVVTAQKREQSLQRVPISINAFNAEALRALSAESIGDIDSFTPGLSINDTSVTQPSYTIRGVQTDDFGIGTEPSVGIFIDGIYSGRSGASLIFFNDIARVEVLKGPQGTLFGRNTSAGAISIISNQPNARQEMHGTVQIGNDRKARLDVTGNTPITDNLFLRINGVINRRDGYLRDAVTGERREREDSSSGRIALRWEPSSATNITLAFDHDDTNKDGPASIGISYLALSRSPFGPFTNDVIDNRETRLLNDASLTINSHVSDAITLTSISSWKHFETHNREDEDGTGDPTRYLDTENIETNTALYQELRAAYDSDRVNALIGVSYYHERGRQTSAVTLLSDSVNYLLGQVAGFPIFSVLEGAGVPGLFGQQYREDMNNRAANDSFAAFADATVHLNDKLSVIAGIRYTHDRKQFTWSNGGFTFGGLETTYADGTLYNAILGVNAFPAGPVSVADFYRAAIGPNGLIFDEGALEGVPFTRTATFNDVSPRFVLQYQADRNLLLYASATRGYKAGGFNSVQINSFFAPENVWNFEGGFKSELFDRRVRFNVSAYYFKYNNRQSISLENTGGQIPQYVTRSGDSEAYGVDVETQFVVSRDLTLSAIAGYIHSNWLTRTERGINIDGQPTGEPRFRSVVSLHYDHELNGGGSIFADASWSFTSRQLLNDAARDSNASIAAFVDFSQLDKLYSSRHLVNARLGWRLPGDQFSIAIYGENIFDDRRPRTLNTISADTFGTPYVRLDRPAFYGVEVGFHF